MTPRTPGPTLDATVTAGAVARAGTRSAYRRLALAPGAPRVVRDELGTGGRRDASSRSLLYLAHITDLQLTDVQSPGRFEFLEAFSGMPGSEDLLPAQRPQEAFCAHGTAAMVRSIRRRSESPDTGAALALAVSTGDSIDNAQWNELEWYLSLVSGGTVGLGAGGEYEGVQRADWPTDLYWRPDDAGGRFQRDRGFPTLPGVLDEAVASFETAGLPVPWVSCFGNHTGLPFGEVLPTHPYRDVLAGGRKATDLPPGLQVLGRSADLYAAPESFLAGPARPVRPDAARRVVGRNEFVAAHLAAPGLPHGHGFTQANLDEGTAYAALDAGPAVRLLLLDTANLDGDPHGSLGVRQLRWLEEQLAAVHSTYRAPDGSMVRSNAPDRLVVLASHHGLSTLTNLRRVPTGFERDQPRAGHEEVRALLHRFPNVVLWLNGHRHVNEIELRVAPDGTSALAEVSTCSIADWPSQARLVELVANRDGTLSVLTEMIDHGAPADPADATATLDHLGSLHREVGANVPGGKGRSVLEGAAKDRNVELLLRAPFPLAAVV